MTPSEKLRKMESSTEIDFTSPRLEQFNRIEGGKPILVAADYWRASVEFHKAHDFGVAITSKEYLGEDFDGVVESIWKDYQKFVEA